jgi:hypothetical protein
MTWITGFRCAVLAGLTAWTISTVSNFERNRASRRFSGLTLHDDGANAPWLYIPRRQGRYQALTRLFIEA